MNEWGDCVVAGVLIVNGELMEILRESHASGETERGGRDVFSRLM